MGKRGRPRIVAAENSISVSVRLVPSVVSALKGLGEGSMSRGIYKLFFLAREGQALPKVDPTAGPSWRLTEDGQFIAVTAQDPRVPP